MDGNLSDLTTRKVVSRREIEDWLRWEDDGGPSVDIGECHIVGDDELPRRKPYRVGCDGVKQKRS